MFRLPSRYDIFTIGAGYLDVAAALSNDDRLDGRALSPTAFYDTEMETVQLRFGDDALVCVKTITADGTVSDPVCYSSAI